MNWVVSKNQFLTLEEVQRLFSVLTDARDLALQRGKPLSHVRDFYVLHILLETGLRVFELTELRCEDFVGGSLIVKSGKGGKKRTVLLSKKTQKRLKDFIKLKKTVLGEPVSSGSYLFLSERKGHYTTRGIRKRVKLWFKKCGFSESLSCHSCRHSYISHLMASGVDLPTIRNNAGHSSLAVTSIYSHVMKDDLGDLELYSSEKSRKRNNS